MMFPTAVLLNKVPFRWLTQNYSMSSSFGVSLCFTQHGGFHKRFQFSSFLIDDGVKFLIIGSNVTNFSHSACSIQLEVFCVPLLSCFSSRFFGHFRPHLQSIVTMPGRSINLCQSLSCQHMSFEWRFLHNCEFREYNP